MVIKRDIWWWCGERGVRNIQTSSGVAIAFARAAYHCDARSSRRWRRRIRNWRAPASPRPRYAVDARHLHTGLLAAAVARGQEPLALPAPLPVVFITGPQLERDAPLLIIVFSFVYK